MLAHRHCDRGQLADLMTLRRGSLDAFLLAEGTRARGTAQIVHSRRQTDLTSTRGVATNLSDRTVLITGGCSGIGLGMAEAFHSRGSTVIVCAREEQALSATADRLPGVVALPCDLVDKQQREDLAAEVLRRFPDLDILVNNAGIQRYVDLKKGYAELKSGEDEIAINFVAVVELTALFIGHLLSRRSAAVINVSSGLGFMPMLSTPIYSATKAAVHTYTC